MYEILRALELLRGLPEVDPARIAVTGKAEMDVNAMYVSLDGRVERVVAHSPTASHRRGPHYLMILRYTDIAGTAAVLADGLGVYGEAPAGWAGIRRCASLLECLP